MTTLPLSEVEAHLSEIAENVVHTHGRVLITKDGQDYVVLVAAEDLDSIEATLELLRDSEAQRRIEQSESEITRREFLDEKEVRALVDEHRRVKAG